MIRLSLSNLTNVNFFFKPIRWLFELLKNIDYLSAQHEGWERRVERVWGCLKIRANKEL